jgi:hypothetical protein
VALGVRTGIDALWVDPGERDELVSVVGRLDADARVRLAARAGSFVHVVEPGVAYRSLPFERQTPPTDPAVDERLQRRSLHQAAVVLDQSLLRRGSGAAAEVARLAVEQPFDLETGEPLQTRADLQAAVAGIGSFGLFVGVDAERDTPIQEVGAEARVRAGPVSARAQYTRLLPYADRLRRTIYEIGATIAPADTNAWVHFVSGSASLRLGSRVRASYRTDYVLPAPANLPQGARASGFVQHQIAAGYASPCGCWQIDASAAIPADEPLSESRVSLTLTVAGYSVGN